MFRFNENDIKYFRTLAIHGNELYDFSDNKTQDVYNSLLDKTKAAALSRDTTTFS